MLTPDQIDAIRTQAGQLTDPVTDFLIRDIASRVSEAGQLTSTAAYQVWVAQQLGVSQREVKKRLRALLKVSHRQLRKLLTQSAEVGYNFDIRRFPYVQAVPFEHNAVLQQIVTAAVKLAEDDFTNITQTLGMVDPYGNAQPLQKVYRRCTDYAFEQVATGAADYNTALRRATRNLVRYGVRTIDYESGVHTSLEAAVRRNIMGGLGLMQEQINNADHDMLGCDGWEISAHAASAPDHEPIQGRQYSDAEYQALNNSLVRRIGTLNCGHEAFPIILGVSSPQYTPEELEKLRADNAKGVTVNGKHYTMYQATQRQRQIERAIRKQKWKVAADEGAGDSEQLQVDKTKLTLLRKEYRDFSKAAGLRQQSDRVFVAASGGKGAGSALTVQPDGGIIEKTTPPEEKPDVHTVGHIDREIYKCVTEDIQTDEVIITDERIAHIKERHPNDFERYSEYIADIVAHPQYILEANKPNTAFLLKEYAKGDERFQMILRLAVTGDVPGYKNSVITFLKVEEKRFQRYLRTKNILYKSE